MCVEFLWPLLTRDPYAELIYTTDNLEPHSFSKTRFLRCLEKAAIKLPHEISEDGQVKHTWKLCSVAEVEEAKIVVRMVPIWLTFVICGIVSSIGKTYFSEQANNMNRKIGKLEFLNVELYLIYSLIKYVVFRLCAYWFVKKYKAYGPPLGIGVAMISSVLCCIIAAVVETERLKVIKNHGLVDRPDEDIPMSSWWLLFQFLLLAGLDSFLPQSVDAFYKEEGARSMTFYLSNFAKGVNGLGYMFGVLSVYVVGKVSEIGGRENWFQRTLNESRLDRYYWVLAGLSFVNLVVYIGVASTYKYHEPEAQEEEMTALPADGNNTVQ